MRINIKKPISIHTWTVRDNTDIYDIFKDIGVDKEAWDIMADKSRIYPLLIDNLSMAGSNVLKQTALSLGAEAAVHGGVIDGSAKSSKVLLFGTKSQLNIISEKLKIQQFHLYEVSEKIKTFIQTKKNRYPEFKWKLKSKSLDLKRPFIVGILNLTPDSFYDGGKWNNPETALEKVLEMIDDGADMIDIGGESSRPGSDPVPADEEIKRILPVIKAIKKQNNTIISIDTRNSETAEIALDNGCEVINDISSFSDKNMPKIIKKYSSGLVLMHMKGKPKTMQEKPEYHNVFNEVSSYLKEKINFASNQGIDIDSIVCDPGFGFGKLLKHNTILLNHISDLGSFLSRPVYVGLSRKSMIKHLGGGETPNDRLEGSISLNVLALLQGASIFRVHNVKSTVKALKTVFSTTGGFLWI